MDRLGDGKDQVRDQAQSLIIKLMEQAATPMVSKHLKIFIFLSYLPDLVIHFVLVYSCASVVTSLYVTST